MNNMNNGLCMININKFNPILIIIKIKIMISNIFNIWFKL